MDRLVSQDELELLSSSHHFILAQERQHHDESRIEENSFHYYVESNQVMNKALHIFYSFGIEVRIKKRLCHVYYEFIFMADAWDAFVHGIDFFRIEPERIAAVDKGVGMHRLFVCLAQKILPAFRV